MAEADSLRHRLLGIEVIDLIVDRLTVAGSYPADTDEVTYVDQAWECWAATGAPGRDDQADRGGRLLAAYEAEGACRRPLPWSTSLQP